MDISTSERIFELTKQAHEARSRGDLRLANRLRDQAIWIASVSRRSDS